MPLDGNVTNTKQLNKQYSGDNPSIHSVTTVQLIFGVRWAVLADKCSDLFKKLGLKPLQCYMILAACFIETRTPLGGEKSNRPQWDGHKGQSACGDSSCSSDLPPCDTLAATTGRGGYLKGFGEGKGEAGRVAMLEARAKLEELLGVLTSGRGHSVQWPSVLGPSSW
eukprot:2690449-Rhodomonas_salina.1